MGVDQAGNQRMARQVFQVVRLIFGEGFGNGQQIHDASPVNGQGMPFQHHTLRLHRNNPTRLDQNVDVHMTDKPSIWVNFIMEMGEVATGSEPK